MRSDSVVQRRRAKMAEIRQRYPGLQRAFDLAGYYAGAVPMSQFLETLTCWDRAQIQRELSGNRVEVTAPRPTSGAINLTDLLDSRSALRINDHAAEIVTPGYQSSQGASMSSLACNCELCRPQYNSPLFYDASKWALNLKGNVYNGAMPITFGIDLGLSSKPKEQSMSPEASRVIADLQSLDEKDFPAISKEIDRIKDRRKDAIEENLDGVARMALMDKSTKALRSFVVSYFKDGGVHTTQGVELGRSNLVDEKHETDEYRVFVFGRDYPVCGTAYTMKRFEKALKDSNIPYVLVYHEDAD